MQAYRQVEYGMFQKQKTPQREHLREEGHARGMGRQRRLISEGRGCKGAFPSVHIYFTLTREHFGQGDWSFCFLPFSFCLLICSHVGSVIRNLSFLMILPLGLTITFLRRFPTHTGPQPALLKKGLFSAPFWAAPHPVTPSRGFSSSAKETTASGTRWDAPWVQLQDCPLTLVQPPNLSGSRCPF